MKKKRLAKLTPRFAKLTPDEKAAWESAYYYYGENRSELLADELAWRDLQLEFPRLKKFDGCKA